MTRRVDAGPLVKVLDFGIAKAMSGDAGPHPQPDHARIPGYMSPEQIACC